MTRFAKCGLGNVGHRARLLGIRARSRGFVGDDRGVGVVEFSLIVPAMLLIYCALGELANALETSRKVGQFTRTIADLIGRTNVTDTRPVFDAAAMILQPYDVSKAKIRVSAMGVYKLGGNYYAVVCSSAAQNNNARPRFVLGRSSLSEVMEVPPAYRYDEARYIMAEVTMPYTPVLGSSFFKWINKADAITFNENVPWPQRPDDEIVLPGGTACL